MNDKNKCKLLVIVIVVILGNAGYNKAQNHFINVGRELQSRESFNNYREALEDADRNIFALGFKRARNFLAGKH